jgi:pseudouridine-5'-phosphate glycosidase
VPATIGALGGKLLVGMQPAELEALANDARARKLSARDLAAAVAASASGGTTVAGTLRVAAMAGIRVFATGGIGGVHRGSHWDISADLSELARQPLVLVCAGAKAILDLPATLEQFETLSVPVIGYQTDEYPAFYSIESSLRTSGRVDDAAQVAALARAHWQLGGGGILLTAPPPAESALPRAEVEAWIQQAQREADEQGVHGQAVSPFLLARVAELSGGRSLQANLALLRNNARVAAAVAKQLAQPKTLGA